MKRIVLLIAILVASVLVQAQEVILSKVYDEVRDERGRVVSGATVAIYHAGTTTPAVLYSTPYGTTIAANPVTTDEDGIYSVYVAPGIYDLRISRTGFTTREISHQHFTYFSPATTSPSDLTAVQSGNFVDLEWAASSGPGFYRIHKKAGDQEWEVVEPVALSYYRESTGAPYMQPEYDGYGNHWPLDFAFFQDPTTERFHLIFIRDTGIDTLTTQRFGHESSADLVTWTSHPPILPEHLSVDGYEIDMIWSPHVFLHDGKWRMFYTGVDRTSDPDTTWAYKRERIFYAEKDLGNNLTAPTGWTNRKYITDGVTVGTPWSTYDGITGPTLKNYDIPYANACRDPHVMQYDGKWYLFYTSMSDTAHANADKQVMGVADASSVAGPYRPLGYVIGADGGLGPTSAGPESMSVIHASRNGHYYLIWCNSANILYARSTSGSPLGPYGSSLYLNHPPGSSTPSAYFMIPEFMPGPLGPAIDFYPFSGGYHDSWVCAWTKNGSDTQARRIYFQTMVADYADTLLHTEYISLADRSQLGAVTTTAYIDKEVNYGVTYKYAIEAGFFGGMSDTATVTVYPYVHGYVHSKYAELEEIELNVILDGTPVPEWEIRGRHVINSDSENTLAVFAEEAPEFCSWITEPQYDRSGRYAEDELTELAEGWVHFHVQIRASGSPEAADEDGYDQEFYDKVYVEPETFGLLVEGFSITGVDSTENGYINMTVEAETDTIPVRGSYKWRHFTDGAWVPSTWDSVASFVVPDLTDTLNTFDVLTSLYVDSLTSDVDSLAVLFLAGSDTTWGTAASDSVAYERATPGHSKFSPAPGME